MSYPHIGFIMEQTLGHITHDLNLQATLTTRNSFTYERFPVLFHNNDIYDRLPVIRNNWTLKASLRSRDWLKSRRNAPHLDAVFFHTQVTTLFSIGWMRRHPTIISMDATPKNIDSLGEAYQHSPSRLRWLEAWKDSMNKEAYQAARGIITWCQWAKNSLINDYGIDGDKITVIPPGVNMERWNLPRETRESSKLHLLFVGGNFQRKGGHLLLKAFKKLPNNCMLDIVTQDPLNGMEMDRVHVHNGVKANSPEMLALFQKADIFVFPSNGDCLPLAVMEAMAASLPVIASNVGAISEEVADGVTGYLIPAGNEKALVDSIAFFIHNPQSIREMGMKGRERALKLFNSQNNYQSLVDCMLNIAE